MQKSTFITIALLFLILLLVASYTVFITYNQKLNEVDSDASQTLQAQESTPYTDMEGNPFSFEDFRGQVRVVNTWASWCPFCANQLLQFEEIAKEYQDRGVTVIAINRKEPRERAKAFLNTVGEFEQTNFAIDLTDAYYRSVDGFSMPETVFYDRDGNIVLHKRGEMTPQEIRFTLDKILSQ